MENLELMVVVVVVVENRHCYIFPVAVIAFDLISYICLGSWTFVCSQKLPYDSLFGVPSACLAQPALPQMNWVMGEPYFALARHVRST